MILCIEIDQNTKSKLDELLRIGEYRDYSQAVAVAVGNQILLHQNLASAKGSLLLSGNPNDRSNVAVIGGSAGSSVPRVFALSSTTRTDAPVAQMPNDAFVPGAAVPVDRWIFGQHNKLLPVKASCRALATLTADGNGIPLARAAVEIASQAVELGDYLRRIDERNGFSRDEALAVAFPLSDSDTSDKARLRYANQFVANINKQGQLSGLLVDLKLINAVNPKEPRLLLTPPGWQFAAMQNPVLDGNGQGLPKFSEEELEFLLGHIRSRVPAEDCAYCTVIRALTDGADNPEKLDAFLSQSLSVRKEKPFTSAFLATQRSGVVSRMTDLGLVQRQRDGTKVTYVPTERALQYVATSGREARAI